MDLLGKLPEDCIAKVLSFTSPQDACRLSLVGPTFRSAADSDAVWEAFMPSDYKDIIARASLMELISPPPPLTSIKELYFRLADTPLIIDHGTKSFSLEKRSGRKCYMLAARDLRIIWTNEPRYWRFKSLPESRFPEVAELINVCWLEINGKISRKLLSPNTLYGAYLVFKFTSKSYGFEGQAMEISCGISELGDASQTQTVFLLQEQDHENISSSSSNIMGPEMRRDGWMEIKMGEYFSLNEELNINNNNIGDIDDHLHMSLKEVRTLYGKRGLIVEGIEIRPVQNSDQSQPLHHS